MIKRLLLFIFLLAKIALYTWAQDGNYWSESYGNRSLLLNGTVNASVEDLGLVFYNPGRLGLLDNPTFAISAKVFELSNIKIENDAEDGINLNKGNFGGTPSLVAGTFNLKFLKNHRFAYSFLTRHRNNTNFFARAEKEVQLKRELYEDEFFVGKLKYLNDFKDEWMGLTWNPPATEYFSAGLTTFISSLRKISSIETDIHAINKENGAGYFAQNRTYNYKTWGLLMKFGLAWDLPKIKLGFTLTTPRINVKGNASTLMEDYLIGVDTTGDGNDNDLYVYNTQNISNVIYKSPWAIGLGMGIPFKKGIVHLSGEWYSKVPEYTIFEIEPFVGQSSGNIEEFRVTDEAHSIINAGIGLEYGVSEKITAYASIASDYSATSNEFNRFHDEDGEAINSVFHIDYYQYGGGISINTELMEITVGATRKRSSQEFEQSIDFPPNDENSASKLIYSRWRFLIGFSFSLKNEDLKKDNDVN